MKPLRTVLAALSLLTVALVGVDPRSGANEAHAAVPGGLDHGGFIRRSSAEGTLTAEDRRRFRELGLGSPQSAAVIIRTVVPAPVVRSPVRNPGSRRPSWASISALSRLGSPGRGRSERVRAMRVVIVLDATG